MLARINNILIIPPARLADILGGGLGLFGEGREIGLNIFYKEQPKPEGIAQAFIIGEEFIGKDSVCLILGDNIFYGHSLLMTLQKMTGIKEGACIFGYCVSDRISRIWDV